jgi:uncharacterized protein YbaP (TraB family)
MKIRAFPWFRFLSAVALSLSAPLRGQAAAPAAHHCLWKLEGKANTVYFLGSVHVLKETNYPLAAPIEQAFTNSQIAVFEADIAALNDPSLALKMMAKGTLPEGETLEKQLSPESYKAFQKQVEEAGMPAAMMERMTPAMAAMTLEVFELMKLGLDPEAGVDKHYFGLAKKQGKQTIGLETVEFQMNLLSNFSKEEGEALMKSTLRQMDSLKKDLDELMKAWETGDGEKLDKMLNEAMADSPAIYKRLLTDRNRNWLPKLEELAQGSKNTMVIVGAGHLVGKEGVVELLRKKGYKISQL